jgi:hypothetical protein
VTVTRIQGSGLRLRARARAQAEGGAPERARQGRQPRGPTTNKLTGERGKARGTRPFHARATRPTQPRRGPARQPPRDRGPASSGPGRRTQHSISGSGQGTCRGRAPRDSPPATLARRSRGWAARLRTKRGPLRRARRRRNRVQGWDRERPASEVGHRAGRATHNGRNRVQGLGGAPGRGPVRGWDRAEAQPDPGLRQGAARVRGWASGRARPVLGLGRGAGAGLGWAARLPHLAPRRRRWDTVRAHPDSGLGK